MRAETRDPPPTESFVAHLLAASEASDETRPQLPSIRADPKGRAGGAASDCRSDHNLAAADSASRCFLLAERSPLGAGTPF